MILPQPVYSRYTKYAKEEAKHKKTCFPAENFGLTPELGECIRQDVELLRRVGWQKFVKLRCNGGDLSDFNNVDNHPRASVNHPPINCTTQVDVTEYLKLPGLSPIFLGDAE